MQFYGRSNFLPPVIKNLIILNVIFFVAKFLLSEIDLDNLLGLHYPTSQYFKPFQFITYMFMHANLMHIFFNMYGLWMLGPILENSFGSKRFLFYYIFTGIGAALLHFGISYFNIDPFEHALGIYVDNPGIDALRKIVSENLPSVYHPDFESFIKDWSENMGDSAHYIRESTEGLNQILASMTDVPLVGASGAIFGILLAFGMLYPMVELYLFFIPFPIKAKWFVIGYGLIELFLGIANSSGDNVAHFAHLGGMLFGYILILYWKKTSNRIW
jgi:membrane associated rhomboid family serine protease